MLNVMYEAPSNPNIKRVIITEETVTQRKDPKSSPPTTSSRHREGGSRWTRIARQRYPPKRFGAGATDCAKPMRRSRNLPTRLETSAGRNAPSL
jgi:hypothetical protein